MTNGSNSNQPPKVAIVTGVSSGIGQEIAQLLAKRGWQVFGTVRKLNEAASIAGVQLLSMDVTNLGTVNHAVQTVLQASRRIDALVNNAGYALTGALEETSIEEAQQQFDTNFFGIMRTTQAVLPTMRQQRAGRIVNISSVLGFLPAPYMGVYAASKHAVEGYTETLDHEVRRFGIRAVLVEPGYTRTALGAKTQTTARALTDYASERQRAVAATQSQMDKAAGPAAVAGAVYTALTSPLQSLRYPVGQAVMLSWLRRFAPSQFLDHGLRSQFQLDG
ncbi:MAG: oxidoreductase [Chloroflexi bacterium]|nr:oxidoreductase [Chloroflexota bacterium]